MIYPIGYLYFQNPSQERNLKKQFPNLDNIAEVSL
jgi:hypothetical protein